jgi:hypothetical protein
MAGYGAEFRTDVETFIARGVEAAVVPGQHELPPVSTNSYLASSTGAVAAPTTAIGCRS